MPDMAATFSTSWVWKPPGWTRRAFLRVGTRRAQPQVDEGLPTAAQQLMAQHPTNVWWCDRLISRNQASEPSLLGRNGSDYSATQIPSRAGGRLPVIWSAAQVGTVDGGTCCLVWLGQLIQVCLIPWKW